jgi:hypothetical protein
MSKLVYKSINEIINKKFMAEKMSPEMERRLGDIKDKNQKEYNNADVVLKDNEANKARERREQQAKDADKRKRDMQQNLAQGKEQRTVPENFDAQAVPGMPPVGMPPTAAPAPPAPMPKPMGAPNYEGGNMTKTQLCQAHEATSNIMASIEDYDSLPDWVKAKITLASEYLVKCESFLNAKDQEHEDSQDEHMPKTPTPLAPAPSPMKPSTSGGTPMMGISLGRVQSVSPGE